MKRAAQFLLIGGGILLMVAAVVMGIATIWTGDDRWGGTAVLVGGTGLIVTFAAGTYPGWDW